jgi:hypothetical protein
MRIKNGQSHDRNWPLSWVGNTGIEPVGAGWRGCCTSLLYLQGLALKDGEVVGRTWSRAVRILTTMYLAWQEAFDRRGYLPSFCELTEHTVVRAAVLALNRQRRLSGPSLKYVAMCPMQS